MPSLSVLAALPLCVAGHGRATLPPNRAGGSLSVAGKDDNCDLGSNSGNLGTKHNTCGYQNRDTWGQNRGTPTNCQAEFMTGNLINAAPANGDCSKVNTKDSVWKMPWAAPGKAALWSPCGVNGGHKNPKDKDKHGHAYESPRDGADLPPSSQTTKWEIGKTADVAFALTKNHGGGYQWRLCPGHSASQHPPDSCFQANPLEFTNPDTTVEWTDGRKKTFKAQTLTGSHVTPHGSQFRVLQIPMTAQYRAGTRKEPCSGCHPKWGVNGDDIRQEWDFSLRDTVRVPHVAVGHAWLQWRWDNEQQDQVWTTCADIEIVAGGSSPPSPAPSPARLVRGESLNSGQTLLSQSGKAMLKMQSDGNLVLRDVSTDKSVWSSKSCCSENAYLNFGSDGILAVRAANKTRLWSPGIHGTPVRAEIQDDCNFVVRDASGKSLWSTGSSCSHSTAISV